MDDFKRGVLAAAEVADGFNGFTTLRFRLGDLLLMKLNASARRDPRRNRRQLPDPEDSWVCGLVTGLAEMHRRLLGGNDSAGVVEVASNCGITTAKARLAGASLFDIKELRKAGVP